MSKTRISQTKGREALRWGQDRRLEFIDFRLLWDGKINRSDLTDFFGTSVPQASLDIARYTELAPENVEYDKSEKVYLASRKFNPVITTPASSQYLNQLLAVNSGMMSREMSFLGWYPNFGAVLSPSRIIRPATLFRVLRAIRNRSTLEIEYQSLNRPTPTKRPISPHAIAYDGFRWHARAYCHERNDFRDFVFARILKIVKESKSDINPEEDKAWDTVLELQIKPHPELPLAHKRAIELDYGMKEGKTIVKSRKALLFYTLRRLGLENDRPDSPKARQIILANKEELAPHLSDA